tara:strand:+ start:595 stop:810 length:216 start_codon:yes stop_codon:yes gene_type:complete
MNELLIKKKFNDIEFNDIKFNNIDSNNTKILINTINELIQVIKIRISLTKEEDEYIQVIKDNIDNILKDLN